MQVLTYSTPFLFPFLSLRPQTQSIRPCPLCRAFSSFFLHFICLSNLFRMPLLPCPFLGQPFLASCCPPLSIFYLAFCLFQQPRLLAHWHYPWLRQHVCKELRA